MKRFINDYWGLILYIILILNLMFLPLIGMTLTINRDTAKMKSELILDQISRTAQSLCNYSNLDDQDTCINRLIDDYKRIVDLKK